MQIFIFLLLLVIYTVGIGIVMHSFSTLSMDREAYFITGVVVCIISTVFMVVVLVKGVLA